MINRFINVLTTKCKVKEKEPVLVAISGGADSVALLHLFHEAGFQCVAAHCNFSLRGEESDEDERFVTSLCKQLGINCFTQQFDTTGYAKEHKVSIEMAARELRYNWFNNLAETLNINLIATGHHGDDAIESFFLNLTRGTGLKGLTGISWRKEKLIRPLLFAASSDIEKYCNNNNLNYRTDCTNSETKYLRNNIRHRVVPLFREMNPAFFETMQNNMSFLNEAWEIFSREAENVQQQLVAKTDDATLIPIRLINNHPQKRSMLFEMLKPYGFQGNNMEQIVDCLDGIPGKQFFSEQYRLIIDRYNLILLPRYEADHNCYVIEGGQSTIKQPVNLNIRVFERDSLFEYSKNPMTAHFDADLIDFPLTIRRPKPGDRFQPLGMQQHKKLSNFFVDEKLSLIQKEKIWLLTNGTDILWIMGMRIDNRYKVTPKSKRILEIEIVE
ncbi:tRNA lysidine(34) synthetase TilS [Alkaliflexus imshenetskii]|uniref:tRNA lysidine(34) synthetase TilS n=1 Tax=Alkaliflexus imshenetskii TaxID=286730 RepID=UPI00047CC697|nr:tRNA lysidine(34) synthetase TilS [Alkaliflexus imshenetskii]